MALNVHIMRLWCSGNIPPSQGVVTSSSLVSRSFIFIKALRAYFFACKYFSYRIK